VSNGETIDLAPERLEKIVAVLKQRHVARVQELCDATGASPATVRRDLAELESRGQLHRVHGGAVYAESRLEEPLFDDKATLAAPQKQRIAEKARALIKPGDSVFLDGGSTVLALARLLADASDIMVVTNSLRVAGLLAGGGPRMILIGGELRRLSQTFVGTLTEPLIDQLHVDKAFMGTIGLSADAGLTTTDPREAQTKSLVMRHARQVILLADSSKLGKVSFVRFGFLKDVDLLITDEDAKSRTVRELCDSGMEVETA
jgi:DeoR/GlpR family transcriptional regulator of sugar metabolism